MTSDHAVVCFCFSEMECRTGLIHIWQNIWKFRLWLGVHLVQCVRSATIWVFGRNRDPYFVILGASLLFGGALYVVPVLCEKSAVFHHHHHQ